MVRQINKSEIIQIYKNAVVSKHARKRLSERGATLEDMLKSTFAYVNVDGSINIAINDYEYFVFVEKKDCHLLITYKERSKNNITVAQKYMIALNGRPRVNKKLQKTGG